jgi:hypothetical protein
MTMTIAIPIWEWEAALSLTQYITVDERQGIGQIRLRGDGTARRWFATDSYRLVAIHGGSDDREYDLGLPLGMVRHAFRVCGGESVDLVVEEVDDSSFLTVTGGGGHLTVPDLGHSFPDVDWAVGRCADPMGTATVTISSLLDLLWAATTAREVDDQSDNSDSFPAPFWLSIVDGAIGCSVDWPEIGSTSYWMVEPTASGDVMVRFNPGLLRSVLVAFRPDEEVVVEVSRSATEPVRFHGSDRSAGAMPIRTAGQQLRDRTEELIDEACGHLATVRDSDGDYPLRRHGTPIYGRLVFGDTPVLQVFSVVVNGIEASADLLAELNDLNAGLHFARLFQIEDQVLAEVDLVAETLDVGELRVAIDRIGQIALEVMPTLSAVFGGEVTGDPAERRLAAYRAAIVEAEVSPGALAALNGPDAVEAWPFPGTVHVLTGWNPQGVVLDNRQNSDTNIRIAEDVLRHGARFVHGTGRAREGDYSEPSVVAWGLDRDEARTMGQRAAQDAIFEIDEHTVRLVSCMDDRVESWPRREPA